MKNNLHALFSDCNHYFEGTLEQSTLNVLRKNEITPSLPNRAQLTTPPGFSIRRSLIPRANMGVWADAFVPKHTILAEYEGEVVENPTDFTYCWQVRDRIGSTQAVHRR